MLDKQINILWDSSHIWGLMVWRAIQSYGLSCKLIKASNIHQQGTISKWQKNAILMVPGGNAKQKSKALEEKGRSLIRQWVSSGGKYIGFCGGAGLALQQQNSDDGLNLCPWTRAVYPKRLYHLVSGNVIAVTSSKQTIELPVWWPGRFAPNNNSDIDILARYIAPGHDLWLADLPLASIPDDIRTIWQEYRNFDPRLCFPEKQPLVISGSYGKGRYLLSYAHLETPQSHQANKWFIELLEDFSDNSISVNNVLEWSTIQPSSICDYKILEQQNQKLLTCNSLLETMRLAHIMMSSIIYLGRDLHLLFKRTSWLWGWCDGIPGMACNNLLAALSIIVLMRPSIAAEKFWQCKKTIFLSLFRLFIKKTILFFWTNKLDRTLKQESIANYTMYIKKERDIIFGKPMQNGGVVEKLINFVEELIYLCQEEKEA